jgi:hypothetical protein
VLDIKHIYYQIENMIKWANLLAGTLITVILNSCCLNKETVTEKFTHEFNLYTLGADKPFHTENAFFRIESFGKNTRYWQPASPNRFAHIVYKVDTDKPIRNATLKADLWGYQSFDPKAQAYLDISTDNVNWVNVAEALPSTADLTKYAPEYINKDTHDISKLVYGYKTVYIRGRLFTTSYSSGGNFGVSQFLRSAWHDRDNKTPTFIFHADVTDDLKDDFVSDKR